MNSLKRLCPVCGAANALELELCRDCGAELRSILPVSSGERLPVPWKEVGASLAVGAGALALRVGLRLAQRYLEKKATLSMQPSVRRSALSAVGKGLEPHRRDREVSPEQPQIRFWGRRVRGRWRGGKDVQVEVEEVFWQGTNSER
jgi:hypothetical protein